MRTLAVLDPAIDPAQYPEVIGSVAAQAAAEGDNTLYAMLLQIEAFGAHLPDNPTEDEQVQFEAARLTRNIHQLPGAVEAAWAYTVDVHGRTWTAMQARGQDSIEESFYPAGTQTVGGRMHTALLAAVQVFGTAG
jgi:hypothetical protein